MVHSSGLVKFYIALIYLIRSASCLISHVELKDDYRTMVMLSSFSFFKRGILYVNVHNISINADNTERLKEHFLRPDIAFMLLQTNQTTLPYEIAGPVVTGRCPLHMIFDHGPLLTMSLNIKNERVDLNCVKDARLPLFKSQANLTQDTSSEGYDGRKTTSRVSNEDSSLDSTTQSNQTDIFNFPKLRQRKTFDSTSSFNKFFCKEDYYIPLRVDEVTNTYSFEFSMHINHKDQEAAYHLILLNCLNNLESMQKNKDKSSFNLDVTVIETNYPHNYLSASSLSYPQILFLFSVLYFIMISIWVKILCKHKQNVVKIHHMMTLLVVTKAFSLLLHSINLHYISLYGKPDTIWSYLYYLTRGFKGALFFITLILIGSGWSFIKHMLSDKDKRIILIIVPLQIIANIAEIILNESNFASPDYEFLLNVFVLVDLFCCLIILYPISWSIKHLKEASRIDGKAAINLKKLELFKNFYVISTIYIYITRIAAFILATSLTFDRHWMFNFFNEFVTMIYFVITGYYFQPLPTNPYTLLATDLDLDEEVVFSLGEANEKMKLSDSSCFDINQSEDGNTTSDPVKQKVTRRLIEDIV